MTPSLAAEYASSWVGIDGVTTTDLIQCGTSEQSSGGITSYFAWIEMLPNASIPITNAPVAPGDTIQAEVDEVSAGEWDIYIDDLTQGWYYSQDWNYDAPGTSAEWVQEAPEVSGSQSTLADFSPVTFSNLGIGGTNLGDSIANSVFMTNSTGTAVIAYASPITAANAFTDFYGSPPPPSVTSITPAGGPSAGGTSVTINGTYLNDAQTVTFGGMGASGSVDAEGTSATVTSPPHASGLVNVIVTTYWGVSAATSADEFTYAPVPTQHGYWLVGADGGIFSFGSAGFHGSTGNLRLQRPVVGITPTSNRGGYWLDASDGGIFAFGDAGFYGSIPGIGLAPAGSGAAKELDAPIAGMVPSADGRGYFMVGSDGGVFAFGDAKFAGSCPGIGGCSGAAVAVVPDATGNGYWVITSIGGVYPFGDAGFYGAPGPTGSSVTSAVRTPDGDGYWILFANGIVMAFGDAVNFGEPDGAVGGADPANAIFATGDGKGYWVASANGSVYSYGDAVNDGSMAGKPLNAPIIAATGW